MVLNFAWKVVLRVHVGLSVWGLGFRVQGEFRNLGFRVGVLIGL